MARNSLLKKNEELVGIIASLNNVIKNLKNENEELKNELEAMLESFEIQLATLNDKHNAELSERAQELKELNIEVTKLRKEVEEFRKNKAPSAVFGAPDVAEQLSLMEQPAAKMNNYFGVKVVNKNDRLDRSKLPPKPTKPEFATEYTIYTDGACLGNGKPGLGYGGWGFVLLDNVDTTTEPIEASGNAGPETTNQVMELTAALEGLRELSLLAPEDATVTLCSDSQYVINGITKWSPNWKANGWTNSKGDPVANKELWQELLNVVENCNLNIEFQWVKGHDSNHYNGVCDLLATSAAAIRAQECGCHEFDENIPEY